VYSTTSCTPSGSPLGYSDRMRDLWVDFMMALKTPYVVSFLGVCVV
jgi:hypothetical protein